MRTRKFKRLITTVITAMALLTPVMPSASAQTANSGVITGVVKDQSGAVVAGATVKAINKGTGAERTTTTSDSGTYELPQLVPGDYRVEVSGQGFATFVADPVTVNVLSRVTIDPDLKPAGSTEQVTVTSEAAPLIETTKT